MKCTFCNGLVLWDLPIIYGNSTCQNCGSKNSQTNEEEQE